MTQTVKTSPKQQAILAVSIVCLSIAAIASQARLFSMFLDAKYIDFYNYWTTGRMINAHENPFDYDLFLQRLQEFEPKHEEPSIMFYMPWIYPLFMVQALLPYGLSHLLWLVVSIIILIFSGFYLWRQYVGKRKNRVLSLLLIVTFCPVAFAVFEGQITLLMFAALVGFLYFESKEQDFWAGACSILLTIKPNTIYLVLLAMLWWVIVHRKWKFVLGAGATAAVLMLIVVFPNPEILPRYWGHITSSPPDTVLNTSIYGLVSRLTGGHNQLALYLPLLLGLASFGFYAYYQHFRWDWKRDLPFLILLSLITTPYAWVHDEVLFVFPLIQAAAWFINLENKPSIKWVLVGLYALVNGVGLYIIPRYRYAAFYLLWIPFAFAGLYAVIYAASRESKGITLGEEQGSTIE